MAHDLNRVQLLGYVGMEPELRYRDTGTALATFSVATNRRWKNAAGEDQAETEWTRVVAWDQLGEIAGQYLHTGTRVYLEGRLRTHSWDDEQTGVRRTASEVVAEELILLGGRARPGMPDATADATLGAADATLAAKRAAPAREPAVGVRAQPFRTPRLRVQPRARLLVPAPPRSENVRSE